MLRTALPFAILVAGCKPTPTAAPTEAPAHTPPHHGEVGADHRSGHVHHRFDDAEQWAEVFDAPERDEWQKPDAVVAALDLPPGAVVADIGAGTGYFTVRLARAVSDGTVVASDIEPDMVRYLTERAEREGLTNVIAVRGTAEDPKLDRDVDVVFLCDVYHHIADRPAFFARVAEHLKPGGRLVIVDFDPEAPEDAPGPPPKMRISAETVSSELAPLGFEQAHVDGQMLPYQYVLVLSAPGG